MTNSPECRPPFLESTKHLHSPSAVQLYDQRIAGGRELGVSKDLDDIRTQSGLEIHVSLHGNGTVLLGHPTATDFESGKVISDDAMNPADFLRAIERLKGFSSVTLDHRPLNGQRPKLNIEAAYLSALARQVFRKGAPLIISSPDKAFLDAMAGQEKVDKMTLQQQVDVPSIWRGLISGVAMRALEKTKQNGGVSEHATRIRIGDGFPATRIGIGEVADFIARDGFKDGIPRTLHATAFPTVRRNHEPFWLGEKIEDRQLANILQVAQDMKGAISGVTRFARHEMA